MKKIFTLFFLFAALVNYAQPKVMTQALITTKTTIVSPEEEDNNIPPPSGGGNGEEMRIMRFFGDGETKSTTWLKNDLVKTYSESETGRTTIFRDNSKKITSSIMEMMGKKMGFYITDSDQVEMGKRMDSMMKGRRQNDNPGFSATPPSTDIAYYDESKKIAGYDCKKALFITTRGNGKIDSSVVWYIPGLKLQGIGSTGGALGGFGAFGGMASQITAGASAMEKLNGFPMQYERNMNRGRKMTVVVTKLVTDKDVQDKEFEIPKDIELKSMKDMQGTGGPGGFQMRIRD